MPHDQIDPKQLRVFPLASRRSEIQIEQAAADPSAAPPPAGPAAEPIRRLAQTVSAARKRGAAVMLAYGAHLVKNGAATLVSALIERGVVTHLATQGAGIIHDWEFAWQGCSSESVRDNAPVGRFGAWDETGRWINLAVVAGAAEGLGFGESIGRFITDEQLTLPDAQTLRQQIVDQPDHPLTAARADLLATMQRFDLTGGRTDVPHPFKRYSIPATAYQHGVPLTVHPGIGYDIIVNHPMYHGGAMGRAAETDARIFAHSALNLTGGVYISIGSAIMSPQVFEKAFSAANNLREADGKPFICDHHIAIVDIQDGGDWDWSTGEPPKDHPAYYLRFCKTFHRMGGTVQYIQADNRVMLANLLAQLDQSD